MSSSCGVCGKSVLDALELKGAVPLGDSARVGAAAIRKLPGSLRGAQSIFAKTGGVHAAGLFDLEGTLLRSAEDVGRHNAVDKVIGAEILAGKSALPDCMLMVSGRTSFEILQKALAAGIPIVAAVGAPSSLAVALARQFNIALLGFVHGERFNIYSCAERIS